MNQSIEESEAKSENQDVIVSHDFMIASPLTHATDIEMTYQLLQKKIKINLIVDCVEHIQLIERACHNFYCNEKDLSILQLTVCIDLKNLENEYILDGILNEILNSKFVKLSGVVGAPHNALKVASFVQYIQNKRNILKSGVVGLSEFDMDLPQYEARHPGNLESFSIVSQKPAMKAPLSHAWTEITLGKNMLTPKRNRLPIVAIAVPVTRIAADRGSVSCKASNLTPMDSVDKNGKILPFLAPGEMYDCTAVDAEETTFTVQSAEKFELGDPLFFQASGEVMEFFNEVIVKRKNEVISKVQTYRGMRHVFN